MNKFTRQEIAQLYFNVSPGTFSNEKEKFLSYLSEYYE